MKRSLSSKSRRKHLSRLHTQFEFEIQGPVRYTPASSAEVGYTSMRLGTGVRTSQRQSSHFTSGIVKSMDIAEKSLKMLVVASIVLI